MGYLFGNPSGKKNAVEMATGCLVEVVGQDLLLTGTAESRRLGKKLVEFSIRSSKKGGFNVMVLRACEMDLRQYMVAIEVPPKTWKDVLGEKVRL
jgi:hypothetical protein